MNIFIASFVIFAIAVTAMAAGVLLGGRAIKGSCGGINTIEGLENACEACHTPCARRKKALAQRQKAQAD